MTTDQPSEAEPDAPPMNPETTADGAAGTVRAKNASSGADGHGGGDTKPKDATDAEPENKTEDHPADATANDPAPSVRARRLRFLSTVAVGAVVLGLAGTAAAFGLEHRHTQQVADQRGAVLTAATDGTKAVLSYRSATVDADLAQASQFLTGDFRDYYRKLGTDAVAPNAKARGLTSVASVAGASTTSLEDGSAGALVFVNQSVTPAAGAASTTSTAIRVHLTRVDGRWLIDRFEPI